MSNTNIKKVRTSDLELKDRLVAINRVTKVTKGGRTFSFSAIVVVGNENGVVGYGLGKASEVTSAIAKGVEDAKKNLVKIPVINGTYSSWILTDQISGRLRRRPDGKDTYMWDVVDAQIPQLRAWANNRADVLRRKSKSFKVIDL